MRILSCHNGHRFRLPHWPRYQFIDVLYAGDDVIFAKDEEGKKWESDNHHTAWIHIGITPQRSTLPTKDSNHE